MPRDRATVYADRRLVGERLLGKRLEAGFETQQAAAAALGRPQSFVSDVETGQRRVDVVELLDIAAVYGFDPCAVIGPPKDDLEAKLHAAWAARHRAHAARHAPPSPGRPDREAEPGQGESVVPAAPKRPRRRDAPGRRGDV